MVIKSKKNLVWLGILVVVAGLAVCKGCEDNPQKCYLVAAHTGLVVCAEKEGRAPLKANRQNCFGAWEIFLLESNNDGSSSLKSLANNKYVSARPDGRLIAEAPKVDEWEKFDLKKVPGKDDTYTMWSRCTQKFVSVDENAGNKLIANRDVASAWEEFQIRDVAEETDKKTNKKTD